jgi:hypothetical protein
MFEKESWSIARSAIGIGVTRLIKLKQGTEYCIFYVVRRVRREAFECMLLVSLWHRVKSVGRILVTSSARHDWGHLGGGSHLE